MDHNTLSYIHSLITCIYTLAGGTLQAHALCPCLFGQEQPSLSIAVSNTRLEEAWTERGRKAWCPLYRFESDMYIYIYSQLCIYICIRICNICVSYIVCISIICISEYQFEESEAQWILIRHLTCSLPGAMTLCSSPAIGTRASNNKSNTSFAEVPKLCIRTGEQGL